MQIYVHSIKNSVIESVNFWEVYEIGRVCITFQRQTLDFWPSCNTLKMTAQVLSLAKLCVKFQRNLFFPSIKLLQLVAKPYFARKSDFLGDSFTTSKVSVFGFHLVRIFPHSDWILRDSPSLSVFCPNAGKCGPEKLRI